MLVYCTFKVFPLQEGLKNKKRGHCIAHAYTFAQGFKFSIFLDLIFLHRPIQGFQILDQKVIYLSRLVHEYIRYLKSALKI